MTRLLILLLPLALFAPNLFASDYQRYIDTYVVQTQPMFRAVLQSKEPHLNANELEARAKAYATHAAGCQLSAINHYPKRYFDAAVIPVMNGRMTVGEASDSVNQKLLADFEAGRLSLEQLGQMTESAVEKFTACMDEV
ncbi:MAG: hypothetical protein LAT63_04120 [Marinobacter sp.]|nr:hypothetical protein [Marinobacter sp.]